MVNITDEQPESSGQQSKTEVVPPSINNDPTTGMDEQELIDHLRVSRESMLEPEMRRPDPMSSGESAALFNERNEGWAVMDVTNMTEQQFRDQYPVEFEKMSKSGRMFTEEDLMKKPGYTEGSISDLVGVTPGREIVMSESYMNADGPLTYGQKAVGLSFNPSGYDQAHKLSVLYAAIIDILNDFSAGKAEPNYFSKEEYPHERSDEHKCLASEAITQAQTAQMWAVKAITWKDQE